VSKQSTLALYPAGSLRIESNNPLSTTTPDASAQVISSLHVDNAQNSVDIKVVLLSSNWPVQSGPGRMIEPRGVEKASPSERVSHPPALGERKCGERNMICVSLYDVLRELNGLGRSGDVRSRWVPCTAALYMHPLPTLITLAHHASNCILII